MPRKQRKETEKRTQHRIDMRKFEDIMDDAVERGKRGHRRYDGKIPDERGAMTPRERSERWPYDA